MTMECGDDVPVLVLESDFHILPRLSTNMPTSGDRNNEFDKEVEGDGEVPAKEGQC